MSLGDIKRELSMAFKPVVRGLAAGLVGGLVASWVMNQFQTGLQKMLEGGDKSQSSKEDSPQQGAGAELNRIGLEDPSDNATERTANIIAAKGFGTSLSKEEKKTSGEVVHYAFGGTTGAFYGLLSELTDQVTLGRGALFGIGVWLAADEIAVPVLGLSKPAAKTPLSTHAYALASHIVYGITTDTLRRVVKSIF